MSTRKSGRATKAVKYTSASEGSDFEDTKKRKQTTNKAAAAKAQGEVTNKKTSKTTKKRPAERSASTSGETTITATASKRQKKATAPTPAATTQPPAQDSKAEKAAAKKTWQDYLASHSVEGALLHVEPDKTISITQTDALKKYGLKKEELVPLKCWEKKNPLYGGVMRVFVEEEVRVLGERKAEVLGNGGKERAVDGDDEPVLEEKHEKKEKVKTPKQTWSAYITTCALDDAAKLTKEPSESISQTDSKKKYNLTPQDLGCLPHFPRENAAYGKTLKLFNESEVRDLAYRKTAVLAGFEDSIEEDLLGIGKELYEGNEDEDLG